MCVKLEPTIKKTYPRQMKISLEEAINRIKNGEVVAIPTDTVYGLAAASTSLPAIEEIYRLKGRSFQQPLLFLISELKQITPLADELPSSLLKMADEYWPGALTLVLSVNPEMVFERIRANGKTAGFRVPNHPATLNLIQHVGPIVASSVNLSGTPHCETREQIEELLGDSFPVLEEAPQPSNTPSTILIFQENKWEVLRQGDLQIPKQMLQP